MSEASPLLEFFKRGEVARDVRLLAAQGTLAPRANEQLEILVLLLEDPDAEIRQVADATLNRIPIEALQTFLGRSDVSIGLREFFGDRGVFPAEIPKIEVDVDVPLIDAAPLEFGADDEAEEEDRESVMTRLSQMSFPERLKAAMKGTKEERAALIRDPNKLVSVSVLSSPKLSESEVVNFTKMGNVSEEILRLIGMNRSWTKNYAVISGLAKNPKTPLAVSMRFIQRLNEKDLKFISLDRNLQEALKALARKRLRGDDKE